MIEAEHPRLSVVRQCQLVSISWSSFYYPPVGRKRVRRLMAKMGLAPICQRPRTTVPHPEHRIYPLPAARVGGGPAEPSLVRRHYLDTYAARLPLPGRSDGLVEQEGAVLACVEHDGRGLLYRGAAGGFGSVRPPGDLQHRSGEAR